ncbi:hypothetical protein [Nocardia takedensis]|uniref:hypothetical protein n=1 Tax=Nocardia takedensis TaxID=259390 RepID=UPI0002EAEE72|nr:hypothetical protein [Nocardia takedensis]
MSTPEPTAPRTNPIVAKAAAGVRKRRGAVAGPVPAKLYAPTEGQMSLFDAPSEEDRR